MRHQPTARCRPIPGNSRASARTRRAITAFVQRAARAWLALVGWAAINHGGPHAPHDFVASKWGMTPLAAQLALAHGPHRLRVEHAHVPRPRPPPGAQRLLPTDPMRALPRMAAGRLATTDRACTTASRTPAPNGRPGFSSSSRPVAPGSASANGSAWHLHRRVWSETSASMVPSASPARGGHPGPFCWRSD